MLYSTEAAFLLLTPWHQIWFSAFSKIYFDVAEIYRQCRLEESGLILENVDRTHLVLTRGKLVLTKTSPDSFMSCLLIQLFRSCYRKGTTNSKLTWSLGLFSFAIILAFRLKKFQIHKEIVSKRVNLLLATLNFDNLMPIRKSSCVGTKRLTN